VQIRFADRWSRLVILDTGQLILTEKGGCVHPNLTSDRGLCSAFPSRAPPSIDEWSLVGSGASAEGRHMQPTHSELFELMYNISSELPMRAH
jgi:hypothetical protein